MFTRALPEEEHSLLIPHAAFCVEARPASAACCGGVLMGGDEREGEGMVVGGVWGGRTASVRREKAGRVPLGFWSSSNGYSCFG